jgi:hypothetical protein
MHHHYADIVNRIDEEPKWWDANGVPRYCKPSPDATADIYATEVAFVEIACQDCECVFLVSFTWSAPDKVFRDVARLSERVETLHYGDPPNMGCCPAGPTMNSVPLRVVEFWRQRDIEDRAGTRERWERVDDLEVEITPLWLDEARYNGEG